MKEINKKITTVYFITLLIQWIVIILFGDKILTTDNILLEISLVFIAVQLFVSIYPFHISKGLEFNWRIYIFSIFIWILLNKKLATIKMN